MKSRIITVVLVLGVLAAMAIVAATGPEETEADLYAEQNRSPWVDENGVWDNSLLPETFDVLDHHGEVVGVVETRHYGTDLYPLPVLDPNGAVVGHVGEYGYYALGESEPYIADAYTVIEEFDADGERIRHEIIRPIAPEPGHTGPVGHTHENLQPEDGGPGPGDGSSGPVGGTN